LKHDLIINNGGSCTRLSQIEFLLWHRPRLWWFGWRLGKEEKLRIAILPAMTAGVHTSVRIFFSSTDYTCEGLRWRLGAEWIIGWTRVGESW